MMLRLVPAAVLAIALFAAPAEASSVRFHYSASELAAPESIDLLYSRLSFASKAACTTNGIRGIWRQRAQARCTDALLSNFVEKIGDSRLAALHDEESAARHLASRN